MYRTVIRATVTSCQGPAYPEYDKTARRCCCTNTSQRVSPNPSTFKESLVTAGSSTSFPVPQYDAF